MWQLYYSLMHSVRRFDQNDWMFVFLFVVVVGIFCMRGFGSRASY